MFDFSEARDHMVDSQVRTNDVTEPNIHKALRAVPRENFVPTAKQALAYSDIHVKTDDGRYMIRPRDFSKMLQAADIKATDVVLDIAPGRGYSTAVLSYLAETVVGLEASDEKVDSATETLMEMDIVNAAFVKGDLKSGAAEHGPFNVIFAAASVHDVPQSWLSQLANGGRLVTIIPEGPVGRCHVYTKNGDAIGDRVAFDATLPALPGFERKAEFAL